MPSPPPPSPSPPPVIERVVTTSVVDPEDTDAQQNVLLDAANDADQLKQNHIVPEAITTTSITIQFTVPPDIDMDALQKKTEEAATNSESLGLPSPPPFTISLHPSPPPVYGLAPSPPPLPPDRRLLEEAASDGAVAGWSAWRPRSLLERHAVYEAGEQMRSALETWTGPCGGRDGEPVLFSVGMAREPTLHSLNRSFPNACIEFIPAFLKEEVAVDEMAALGLTAPDVFHDVRLRVASHGLSGSTRQDAFTIACSLTHRRVWEMMVARGIPYAMVLESDAIFVGEGVTAQQAMLQAVHQATETDPEWDLLNLGRCWDLCELDVTVAGGRLGSGRIVRSVSAGCTHAFVVSLAGAQKLLTHSLPHVTSIDYLIALLSRTSRLHVYSVSPRLFDQVPASPPAPAVPYLPPPRPLSLPQLLHRVKPALHLASLGLTLQSSPHSLVMYVGA